MAKKAGKSNTTPARRRRIIERPALTPIEQREALRKLAAPEYRKLATPGSAKLATRETYRRLGVDLSPPPEAQKTTVANATVDKRTAKAEAAPTPKRKPKLGRKARLAADMVLALWRDGFRWDDRETLRRKLVERGVKVSMRTLDTVLAKLRGQHLIG